MSSCIEPTSVTLSSIVELFKSGKVVSTHVIPPDVPQELARSIESAGLQQPIMVAVLDGNTWVVIDGEKRLRALVDKAMASRDPKLLASKVPILINKCIKDINEARSISLIINTIRQNEKTPKDCLNTAVLAENLIATRKSLTPSELRRYFWCETCAAVMNYIRANDEDSAKKLVKSLGASNENEFIDYCKRWYEVFMRVSTMNTAVAFFARSLLASKAQQYPNLVQEVMKALEEVKQRASEQEGSAEEELGEALSELEEAVEKEVGKAQAEEELRQRRKAKKAEGQEGKQEASEEQKELEYEAALEYGYPTTVPKSKYEDLNEVVEELFKSGDLDVIKEVFSNYYNELVMPSIRDVCTNELSLFYKDVNECVNDLHFIATQAYNRAMRARYSESTWTRIFEKAEVLWRSHKLTPDGSVRFEMHPLVALILALSSSPDSIDAIIDTFWHWLNRAKDELQHGELMAVPDLNKPIRAIQYIYAGLFSSLYPLRHAVDKYSNIQLPKELADEVESLAKKMGVDEATVVEYALEFFKRYVEEVNYDPRKILARIVGIEEESTIS